MAVPYTFGNATTSIPLSQLDTNFATAITIGNTAVYLGNTTTTFGNVTLNNVTINSGNSTVTKETVTTITSPAATALTIQSAGTTAMTIDTSQNVGIGTASPGYLLQVGSSTNRGRLAIVSTSSTSAQLLLDASANASGKIYSLFSGSSSVGSFDIYDSTAAAYRLTIDTSGNVGIGTASPANLLDVASVASANQARIGTKSGTSANDAAIIIRNVPSATAGTRLARIYLDANGGDGSGGDYFNIDAYGDGSAVLMNQSNSYTSFGTNGTERMRIDSSGNVGIGTTSPSTFGKFAVTGAVATTSIDSNGVRLQFSRAATSYIEATNASGSLSFGTGGVDTNRMFIDSSGNVGVGTTSPSSYGGKLTVLSGSTALSGYFESTDTSTYSATSFNAGSRIAIRGSNSTTNAYQSIRFSNSAAGNFEGFFGGVLNSSGYCDFVWQSYNGSYAERMRIDSSGNVGIGTTPNAWDSTYKSITIGYGSFSGNVDGSRMAANAYYNAGWKYIASSLQATIYDQFIGQHRWFTAGTGTAGNAITFTQAMTLDASGNLLVGKTSTSDTVVGVYISPAGGISQTNAASTNATVVNAIYSTGASAYRFYVGLAGTVYATSTTITAISDQRLKENIQDIDVGLDAIMALKPRKFDWKKGKGKDKKGDRGWIAQEFEQVFPDMIDTWQDPAPEGEEPYKAVNADLIPVLVKAIQQLKAELDALKGTK